MTAAALDDLEAAAECGLAAVQIVIARLRREHQAPIVLRSIAGGASFTVEREGVQPGWLHGTPELRAIHAAVRRPHRPITLARMATTTARDRIAAAVDRLDASVPGIAEHLRPAKSRDGGLSVRPGPALVYEPRRRGAVVALDSSTDSFISSV